MYFNKQDNADDNYIPAQLTR